MDNQGLYRINTSINSENDLISPRVSAPSPIYPSIPAPVQAPTVRKEPLKELIVQKAEEKVKSTSKRLRCSSVVLMLFGFVGVCISVYKYFSAGSRSRRVLSKYRQNLTFDDDGTEEYVILREQVILLDKFQMVNLVTFMMCMMALMVGCKGKAASWM